MNVVHIRLIAAGFLFVSSVSAADSLGTESPRVLLIYDTIDNVSKFYVDALRERLTKKGFRLEESAAGGLSVKDPSSYRCIVVYGMVMAFNMKSPVRKWMSSAQTLENGKILIFVTANRWFHENLRNDLVKLVKKRRGTLVDAVSMATNKAGEAEKIGRIESFLSKLEGAER